MGAYAHSVAGMQRDPYARQRRGFKVKAAGYLAFAAAMGALVLVCCGIWGGDIDINHIMGR